MILLYGPCPGHRADIAARHLPKTEEETLFNRLREQIFMDGDKTEGLVKRDQGKRRVDEDLLAPAGIDQCLDGEPGIPFAAVLLA